MTMFRDISIDEAISLPETIFVDVRSEGEFAEATVPGSINIPIFNNEERVIVGTLYKQKGPKAAKIKGLEIVGPKLPVIIGQFQTLKDQYQNIVIFCWRGGMRSHSIATILGLMDLFVFRIIGGYKAYRKLVNNFFAKASLDQEVVVLRGLTGVGKTEIIQGLMAGGLPIIDLEGLASNRGSVFGAIGMAAPPSQKMFDALLMEKLNQFKNSKYIVVECESKKIGRLYLPEVLMAGMQQGLQILIYDEIENRANRIIADYTADNKNNIAQLQRAISCLENTIGFRKVEKFNELVAKQNYHEVVKYLLAEYYDPLYNYPDQPTADYSLSVKSNNVDKAVQKIKMFLENNDK